MSKAGVNERTVRGSLALAAACVMLGAATAGGQQAPAAADVSVSAENSFNGRAFTFSMRHLRDEGGHRVYALSYPSPLQTEVASNNTVPAEYYVPLSMQEGAPPRPAVICLHILNGNFELVRLLCTFLAENGIPAIFFKLPYYDERAGADGRRRLLQDVQLFSQALEQSLLDIRRTVDVLSARSEVDEERIGVCGISLGAILAGAACGVEPRLSRAQLILGGGDLETILLHARETRALRDSLSTLTDDKRQAAWEAIRRVDPLTHADALRNLAQQDRLAMVNATEDNVIPPACTRQLAEAAGMTGKVTWLEGLGHYTAMAALPVILRDTAAFFARDLPEGLAKPSAPAPAELSPSEAFAAWAQSLATMLSLPPAAGRCHSVSLAGTVSTGGGKPRRYEVNTIRGHDGRFRLEASPVPKVGVLQIGLGEYPWMHARGGTVYVGTEAAAAAEAMPPIISPEDRTRIQVVAGAIMAMSMAPDAFRENLRVTEGSAAEGERRLDISFRQKSFDLTASLLLRRPEMTPVGLQVDADGLSGNLTIQQWAVNAPAADALFVEPASDKVVRVPRRDLLRMFAATFTFAMETVR